VTGPVSRALKGSYLVAAIQEGIQAVPDDQRKHIAASVRPDFLDSLDLDEASRSRHPNDARWDYLLGHAASSQVVALEAHPAQTSQVARVIQKRTASLGHLHAAKIAARRLRNAACFSWLRW
jgi:CHAD domain-containing protein